ncbi:MAG TPA: ATP-binding protein [Gaiellaceae bacterium]|nr:ATP-binding protein [Gaiellaceae bacterium]
MSRLPIRLRLSLVFALTMAVVLAAVGTVLYVTVREALNEQIAENPATRVDGIGERDEVLATLLALMLAVGPLALLLATYAGYRLAGAALRPVESMRREAAEISSATSSRRLPVPEAQDEVRRLGETLNEMLARLDEGLLRERRFVADAGHELRTPLALLLTELELALRRPRSPEDLERAIRSATEEVERLIRLAEGLLVLDRAGEASLRPSELAARELLDAVARRFATRAADAGRALEVHGGGSFRGDRDRLEQALGSLVDNALTHGAGAVTLEAERGGESIALRVSDEGRGFPSDFLPHAFERFSRADPARTTGGAGLGLAIVDAVARAHGGSVSASGPTVTLVLPVRSP